MSEGEPGVEVLTPEVVVDKLIQSNENGWGNFLGDGNHSTGESIRQMGDEDAARYLLGAQPLGEGSISFDPRRPESKNYNFAFNAIEQSDATRLIGADLKTLASSARQDYDPVRDGNVPKIRYHLPGGIDLVCDVVQRSIEGKPLETKPEIVLSYASVPLDSDNPEAMTGIKLITGAVNKWRESQAPAVKEAAD